LKAFSKKLAHELPKVSLVVANDHQECPVALALAKTLSAPCAAILRSSGMSQRDFEKYRAGECEHLFVVGEELAEKTKRWSKVPQSMFSEGFLEDEFLPIPDAHDHFPSEILVAGSEAPGKGFQDLLQALAILQTDHPDLPLKKVVFTGSRPDCAIPELRCELDFVGRVQDFISFAKRFDLAIHPSRHETFGLAPLELIIAGIPTLCTRTGITKDDLLPASWLAPPRSPLQLAEALLDWSQHWQARRKDLPDVIARIHSRFAVSKTSADFFEKVDQLSAARNNV
jgi:glycosyltransferase involved in cell wall biosynthesis